MRPRQTQSIPVFAGIFSKYEDWNWKWLQAQDFMDKFCPDSATLGLPVTLN